MWQRRVLTTQTCGHSQGVGVTSPLSWVLVSPPRSAVSPKVGVIAQLSQRLCHFCQVTDSPCRRSVRVVGPAEGSLKVVGVARTLKEQAALSWAVLGVTVGRRT